VASRSSSVKRSKELHFAKEVVSPTSSVLTDSSNLQTLIQHYAMSHNFNIYYKYTTKACAVKLYCYDILIVNTCLTGAFCLRNTECSEGNLFLNDLITTKNKFTAVLPNIFWQKWVNTTDHMLFPKGLSFLYRKRGEGFYTVINWSQNVYKTTELPDRILTNSKYSVHYIFTSQMLQTDTCSVTPAWRFYIWCMM
jgi:hypothetical protein